MPAANRNGGDSFACPDCGTRDSRVIDSRQVRSYRTRRRICPNGHRFTTIEIMHGTATVSDWLALTAKLMKGNTV